MTTDKKPRLAVSFRIALFVISAAVVLADQLSKTAIVRTLGETGKSATVIPGVLDFEYTLNSGATAGMLSRHRWVFMVISTVVIIGVIAYLALGKVANKLTAVSLAVILGGGIGNMIDRVFNGTVVDFIYVKCLPFFPFTTVFNIADICVSVGCVLLFISVISDEIRGRRAEKASGKTAGADSEAATVDEPDAEHGAPEDTDGE